MEYKKDAEFFKRGKKAAVCFTVDDISPLKSTDIYEGGGDMLGGALGRVKWLLDRHPQLRATLFTTANWSETVSQPTRRLLAKIPWLRDRLFLASRLEKDSMRLTRHPDFVKFLNEAECFEVALHGLYHCHRGRNIYVEFQNETREEFDAIIREMLSIFNEAGLKYANGICPPGWNAPDPLLDALIDNGIGFVASSRDIFTPVSAGALGEMSGIRGLPLFFPSFIKGGRLVHFPTNFQATSRAERALETVEMGGLLSIKAHIINDSMLDSAKDVYMNYLDLLLSKIEDKYGDNIAWTTVGEMGRVLKENSSSICECS